MVSWSVKCPKCKTVKAGEDHCSNCASPNIYGAADGGVYAFWTCRACKELTGFHAGECENCGISLQEIFKRKGRVNDRKALSAFILFSLLVFLAVIAFIWTR